MKKTKLSIVLMIGLIFTMLVSCNNSGLAQDEEEKTDDKANVPLSSLVTQEMCQPSYWTDKKDNTDTILMTLDEIDELNQKIISAQDTGMYDLLQMDESYDADKVKSELAAAEITEKDLYKGGKLLDKDQYFNEIFTAIEETGFSGKQTAGYGICVSRTDVKQWPEADVIGYSEDDTDDEFINTSLNVNEPFLIYAKCDLNDKTYYWGYNTTYSGWVESENIAICQSRDEWLEAWQINLKEDDFLVVTQDKITLETSVNVPEISETSLMLGTILKLVPETEIPEVIGERGVWNNYIVYLPTRNTDGTYQKTCAEISQHYSVSIGFVDMTQENIAQIAFSCLGNRYGWGGMLGSLDCSLYTRSLYRCFGLELPRDTGNQMVTPEKAVDISEMSDEEKSDVLKDLPVGSLLYFPGHAMIYLGTEDDLAYVISATGFVSDPEIDSTHGQYSIVINPLSAKRRDGSTWLSNLTKVVSFSSNEK